MHRVCEIETWAFSRILSSNSRSSRVYSRRIKLRRWNAAWRCAADLGRSIEYRDPLPRFLPVCSFVENPAYWNIRRALATIGSEIAIEASRHFRLGIKFRSLIPCLFNFMRCSYVHTNLHPRITEVSRPMEKRIPSSFLSFFLFLPRSLVFSRRTSRHSSRTSRYIGGGQARRTLPAEFFSLDTIAGPAIKLKNFIPENSATQHIVVVIRSRGTIGTSVKKRSYM